MKTRVVALCVAVLGTACTHVPQPYSPERVAQESTEEPPDATAIAVLDALSLDAEQRTKIVALREKLRAELASTKEVREQFVDAMLAELRAGRMDPDRLAPKTKALLAALEKGEPVVLDGLNELHGILSKEQRKALLDGIAERREKQQGDAKEQMERMSEQLDLGFGQKIAIGKSLKERLGDKKEEAEQLEDDAKAAAEAFVRDDFDAHRLAFVQHLDLASWLDSVIVFAQVVVEELEPSQHATLAAIMEKRLRRED
jgi:hypothetical protein